MGSPTRNAIAANDSPIAYALDFPNLDAARAGALLVRDAIGMVKVGLELFVDAGPAAVAIGREVERPVFLDLKLHDIPETVERAIARASSLGVKFATVHAAGGAAMLARAVSRAKSEGAGLEVVAVTVLTSLDARDLEAQGVGAISGDVVQAHAVRLAKIAFDAGVRAFVCSPREVTAMRGALGDVTLITPGVRARSNEGADDQKRVATAFDAMRAGANWIVVGRPIRDAKDPLEAAKAITREANEGRAA